jgi:hypothetical protein
MTRSEAIYLVREALANARAAQANCRADQRKGYEQTTATLANLLYKLEAGEGLSMKDKMTLVSLK